MADVTYDVQGMTLPELPQWDAVPADGVVMVSSPGKDATATVAQIREVCLDGYKVKNVTGKGLTLKEGGVLQFDTDNIQRGTAYTTVTQKDCPILVFNNYNQPSSVNNIVPDIRVYIYDGSRDLDNESINVVTEKGLSYVLDGYKVKDVDNSTLVIDENGSVKVNYFKDNYTGGLYTPANTNNNPILSQLREYDHFLANFITLSAYDGSRDIVPDVCNFVMEKGLAKVLESAKKDLFIDLWNDAVGSHGTYNAETGFFELNGLTDITYEEAVAIYNSYHKGSNQEEALSSLAVRTNIPVKTGWITSMNRFAQNNQTIEVLNIPFTLNNASQTLNAFYNCKKLREVYGLYLIGGQFSNTPSLFYNCVALERLEINKLQSSFNVQHSPLINLASWQYMIANAANGAAITITVHPDVYAKLTDETNTEWFALLEAAAEKNITFATTE